MWEGKYLGNFLVCTERSRSRVRKPAHVDKGRRDMLATSYLQQAIGIRCHKPNQVGGDAYGERSTEKPLAWV